MSNEKMSLRDTIVPKSDQLNYDDVATQSLAVRVTGLAAGSPDQPVIVKLVRDDNGAPLRDYKPCKSMRRVLIAAWGDKGKDWIGKRMTLFGDANVVFGGVSVGGIRISHVSGIAEDLKLHLTTTRSKRTAYIVKPMADTAPAGAHVPTRAESLAAIAGATAIRRNAALKSRDLTADDYATAPDHILAEVAGMLRGGE